MGKKSTLLSLLLVPMVLSSIVLVIFLSSQQQNVQPKIQSVAAASDASCPAPSQVTNVKVDFPYFDGTNYSFTQAGCSWAALSGATKYSVKITQVETSTVIQNTTVDGNTTKVVFNITPNNTYKCDIGAINSCGALGVVGSDQLLCKVDQTFTSPTPTTPPVPSASPLGCGGSPCNVNGCQAGLSCMQTTTGQYTCGMAAYQTACQQNPSVVTCCSAPAVSAAPSAAPQPTLLPTGNDKPLTIFGIGSVGVMLIGGAALLLL